MHAIKKKKKTPYILNKAFERFPSHFHPNTCSSVCEFSRFLRSDALDLSNFKF